MKKLSWTPILVIAKWLLHLAPGIALLLKEQMWALILLICISLPYIKVKKLEIQLADQNPDSAAAKSLSRAISFWKSLSFLH